MNRKQEQADLFYQLGQLFGPVLKMGDKGANYDSDEQTRIMARLFADAPGFLQTFQVFAYGEPGHKYISQFYKTTEVMNSIEGVARQAIDERLFKHIATLKDVIFDCISTIPVPIDSAIHQAHTPFSTYCFVKSITSAAAKQVVWMDRYTLATGKATKMNH